jgi:hypothetical protein
MGFPQNVLVLVLCGLAARNTAWNSSVCRRASKQHMDSNVWVFYPV